MTQVHHHSNFNEVQNIRFEDFQFSNLSLGFILKNTGSAVDFESKNFYKLTVSSVRINFIQLFDEEMNVVKLNFEANALNLHCSCRKYSNRLCQHQARALFNILKRNEISPFFDQKAREIILQKHAENFGLENENNLDLFFELVFDDNKLEVKPKYNGLFNFSENIHISQPENSALKEYKNLVILLNKHKFYDLLSIELFTLENQEKGKQKNTLKPISPFDFIINEDKLERVKFFTAISKFQTLNNEKNVVSEIEMLKVFCQNPIQIPIYIYKKQFSKSNDLKDFSKINLTNLNIEPSIEADIKSEFCDFKLKLRINDYDYFLNDLKIVFDYFIQLKNQLILISDVKLFDTIQFFRKNNDIVKVPASKFELFKEKILQKFEKKLFVKLNYFVDDKIEKESIYFNNNSEKIIYLLEDNRYVYFKPVIKSGIYEYEVLNGNDFYGIDQNGKSLHLKRNEELEIDFIAEITKHHIDFLSQLENGEFYLSKREFLDTKWVLETFDAFKKAGIQVFGFSTLSFNKQKFIQPSFSYSAISGINWFEFNIELKFENQVVPLKRLHLAIKQKQNQIKLDDGSFGILPEEWLLRFQTFFNDYQIKNNRILVPKANAQLINELFSKEEISDSVFKEIDTIIELLHNQETDLNDDLPVELNANLRPYQVQGFNWLNNLDRFNFGACLADDMGLGKTIQVLAFLLNQRNRVSRNLNLIAMPTSLIFNWKIEIEKFAPSLKTLILTDVKNEDKLNQIENAELVLITYSSLTSEVNFLKQIDFNYIILDESQQIKNPESMRYKMVMMLKSRNKIIMTGTPLENNSMDLYAQFSFVCPGLLGSKSHFKQIYADPIDKFKIDKRSQELKTKISPFILRRTKMQVADELPQKTEMTIYCELNASQQKIYNHYIQSLKKYIREKKKVGTEIETMYVLKSLMRLRQICNSTKLLGFDLDKEEHSSKIDKIRNQILEKHQKHKIVIFSQFVSMLDLIKKELELMNVPFEMLTGQSKNREQIVGNFQGNNEVKVFLISLKAGGFGLNLTAADYIYLVDPWWNPAVENQAIDRIYRIGQQKNVVAVRFICKNTIEEKVLMLQANKKTLADDLIKSDSLIDKKITKAHLLEILD